MRIDGYRSAKAISDPILFPIPELKSRDLTLGNASFCGVILDADGGLFDYPLAN
jgi:hypothetical protein